MPPLGGETFSLLDLSTIVGGGSAAVRRVPAAPGVYSFFRKLSIDRLDDPGEFVDELMAYIDQPAAVKQTTKCGPLHTVSLESKSTLSDRKLSQLKELSKSTEFRSYVAKVVATSSMLQAPMYVGKADNLQSRITQHLDPSSDLATRLREAGIVLDQAILVYSVIDESAHLSDSVLFLIEEVISRICRPGFVQRIG